MSNIVMSLSNNGLDGVTHLLLLHSCPCAQSLLAKHSDGLCWQTLFRQIWSEGHSLFDLHTLTGISGAHLPAEHV
jgi:hypothetical protein